MSYGIISKIATDLKFSDYENLTDPLIQSKIIYSAISLWIKCLTIDSEISRNYDDNNDYNLCKCNSDIYIKKKAAELLLSYIELYPNIEYWFYPLGKIDSALKPENVVFDRLKNVDYILKVGFSEDFYTVPPCNKIIFENASMIYRGYDLEILPQIIGLTTFMGFKGLTENDIPKLMDFFYLDNISALVYFTNILNNDLKWSRFESENCEIQNSNTNKSYSNSWIFCSINNVKTLSFCRLNNKYFLLKNENGILLRKDLDENLYDIKKLWYGWKKYIGNKPIVEIKKNTNDFTLRLRSKLPPKEQNVLMSLGYPERNIEDDRNIIFPNSIELFIKLILNLLNIEVKES